MISLKNRGIPYSISLRAIKTVSNKTEKSYLVSLASTINRPKAVSLRRISDHLFSFDSSDRLSCTIGGVDRDKSAYYEKAIKVLGGLTNELEKSSMAHFVLDAVCSTGYTLLTYDEICKRKCNVGYSAGADRLMYIPSVERRIRENYQKKMRRRYIAYSVGHTDVQSKRFYGNGLINQGLNMVDMMHNKPRTERRFMDLKTIKSDEQYMKDLVLLEKGRLKDSTLLKLLVDIEKGEFNTVIIEKMIEKKSFKSIKYNFFSTFTIERYNYKRYGKDINKQIEVELQKPNTKFLVSSEDPYKRNMKFLQLFMEIKKKEIQNFRVKDNEWTKEKQRILDDDHNEVFMESMLWEKEDLLIKCYKKKFVFDYFNRNQSFNIENEEILIQKVKEKEGIMKIAQKKMVKNDDYSASLGNTIRTFISTSFKNANSELNGYFRRLIVFDGQKFKITCSVVTNLEIKVYFIDQFDSTPKFHELFDKEEKSIIGTSQDDLSEKEIEIFQYFQNTFNYAIASVCTDYQKLVSEFLTNVVTGVKDRKDDSERIGNFSRHIQTSFKNANRNISGLYKRLRVFDKQTFRMTCPIANKEFGDDCYIS